MILEQLSQYPYLNRVILSQVLQKEGVGVDYWVNKLLKDKTLIPLKKGLYTSSLFLLTVQENPGEGERYQEYLANIIRYPSYISGEYVLAKYGLIPEAVYGITSVTVKSTRTFDTPMGGFYYRNIKKELFSGFRQSEFRDKKINIAEPEKALFDFLYLKPKLPKEEILEGLRINWRELDKKRRENFINYCQLSKSSKMLEISKYI